MKKTILFLSEFPLTNGVIQAQLLPIMIAASQKGYAVHAIETLGRFESQEKNRSRVEKEMQTNGIKVNRIKVPRHTFLPSILYFNLHSLRAIRQDLKRGEALIYARNYKFIPLLLYANLVWKIPFIYSPRGAYVEERKFYGRSKEIIYAFFIKLLEKKAIKKSKRTIVETDEFKKHLEHLYNLHKQKNIVVIPNYFEESLLPEKDWNRELLRQKLGFSEKKVIAYAGTLEVWYDFSKMFELVSKLKEKNPDIFFQLFLKEDYARNESCGMLKKVREYADKFGFQEKKDFSISSYSPHERYLYLSACNIGICLTVSQKFKTIMLYLKIVDYWGSGLPVIINDDVIEVKKIIQKSKAGAIVDYSKWDESIAKIEINNFFIKNQIDWEYIEKYSSKNIIPLYLDIFNKAFHK